MACRVVLHLIRHEKTAANLARKYIGWTDEEIVNPHVSVVTPLTPPVIYGSDLIRCKQTAACYFPGIPYEPDARLRESSFGQFEMKTYEQLKDNLQYRAWIDCPGNNPPPDGETFQQFEARVNESVTQIIREAGTYTCIVHGGVIRLLLAKFTQQPFRDVIAQHRTLYTVEWDLFEDFKEGKPCKLLSVVPLTVREPM